jgi:hypothetical protein
VRLAYLIFVGYAVLGFLYAPGLASFTALAFIAVSCAPLLLVADGADDYRTRPSVPSRIFYWGVVAVGLFNLVIIVRGLGRPVSDALSIEGVATIAVESTARRYQVGAASGNPVLLALSLWLAFRVGASADRLPKTKQLVALLPVMLYTLLTTEKWPLLVAGIFFFAGLLLGVPAYLSRKLTTRYAALALPVGLVTAVGAMILRDSPRELAWLVSNTLSYVLAPYTALGSWLIDHARIACCTLGGLSFIGPLNALDLVERSPGVFQQNVVVHGVETNIYTAFRYVVEDFTIVGPFFFAVGVAALHTGLRAVGATALCRQLRGLALFCALMSVNVTPFVHNSVAFAMVLSLFSLLAPSLRLPVPTAEAGEAPRGAGEIADARGIAFGPR